MAAFQKWLGRQDLNLRIRESKPRVLPLDDAPTVKLCYGRADKSRTYILSLWGSYATVTLPRDMEEGDVQSPSYHKA